MSEITEGNKTTEQTENKLVWTYEGKEYPLFLANATGNIGMPISHPNERDKQIGILRAFYAWENSEPFIDHLNIETIDKAADEGDWSERENESIVIKNAALFREIVQEGEVIDFDEVGDPKEPVRKNRKDMLNYRKIAQSDLISRFLNEFHITRKLPKGMTSIDAFLSQNISEIEFEVRVGSKTNPRHIMVVQFNAPNDDQISNYMTDTFQRGQNTDGDWRYNRDNEARLRFSRKHFMKVYGAAIAPLGEIEFSDENQIREANPNNAEDMAAFKRGFNPNWMVRLGEEVAGAFNLAKK